MLLGADRIELPADVRLGQGEVADAVRGTSWPVNATGAYVLGRAGDTLDAIAGGLAAVYAIDGSRAATDVSSFVARMNSLLLVNVHARGRCSRWLALAIRLLPLRALPPPLSRRVSLGGTRLPRVAAVARALAPRAALLAFATATPPIAMGLLAPSAAAAAGCAAGVGLIAHEAAHLVALGTRPAALVLRGSRVFVLHQPLHDRLGARVALAGPLAPGALGLLLVGVAAPTAAPTVALAGGLLAAHALGANVAGRDGRTACGL